MELNLFFPLVFMMLMRLAHPMRLTETQVKCYVNSTSFEDGEKYNHWFEGSPCKFECTCLIRKAKGVWAPTGSCVHRCPSLSYPPYGCKPISDGCCARSYTCADGEKCQDEETGMMYAVGQIWHHKRVNGSCACNCYGEGVGRYQCKCVSDTPVVPRVMDGAEDDKNPVENPCVMDDSQYCTACPIGMVSCPIRAKCERWLYFFGGINLECTCYGRRGTRCVNPIRGEKSDLMEQNGGIRARRSANQGVLEIYFSEDKRQTVEPSITQIQREA